jgi:hypothetical protein
MFRLYILKSNSSGVYLYDDFMTSQLGLYNNKFFPPPTHDVIIYWSNKIYNKFWRKKKYFMRIWYQLAIMFVSFGDANTRL